MKQIYFKFSVLLACLVMGLGSAMAQNNAKGKTYYAKVTPSSNGNGTAQVRFGTGNYSSDQVSGTGSAQYLSFDIKANPNPGYHFESWSVEKGTINSSAAETTVSVAGGNNEGKATSATVTATFAPNTYVVKFDGNGATGTMGNQSFTYDVAQDLTANAFKKSATVTLVYADGVTENSQLTSSADFTGWKNGNNNYKDGDEVSNLTTENNATVTLTAQWSAYPAVELSTSTRDGYTFDGWYDGDTKVEGNSYTPTADVTLTAHWTENAPVAETIKLNAYGYGTYSRAYAAEITGAGVYTAKINNGSISCYKVEDGIVPAGVGVLLYGEPSAVVTITLTTTDQKTLDNNELYASTLADGSLAQVPAAGAYTLSGDTFKTYNKDAFVHGKAYFKKPDMTMGGLETKVFSFEFADETTAISTIKANVEGVAYNLAGQRVAPTTKGIVIINGKKYFNK